ncbi:MAG: IS4 family transposase, partial [Thermaerobacter sp.]|nr:IS4 family transposase [Thermaerobacter sp.]
ARLGGFLGRRRDGDPGVKVLWRGFRDLQRITEMWEILQHKT